MTARRQGRSLLALSAFVAAFLTAEDLREASGAAADGPNYWCSVLSGDVVHTPDPGGDSIQLRIEAIAPHGFPATALDPRTIPLGVRLVAPRSYFPYEFEYFAHVVPQGDPGWTLAGKVFTWHSPAAAAPVVQIRYDAKRRELSVDVTGFEMAGMPGADLRFEDGLGGNSVRPAWQFVDPTHLRYRSPKAIPLPSGGRGVRRACPVGLREDVYTLNVASAGVYEFAPTCDDGTPLGFAAFGPGSTVLPASYLQTDLELENGRVAVALRPGRYRIAVFGGNEDSKYRISVRRPKLTRLRIGRPPVAGRIAPGARAWYLINEKAAGRYALRCAGTTLADPRVAVWPYFDALLLRHEDALWACVPTSAAESEIALSAAQPCFIAVSGADALVSGKFKIEAKAAAPPEFVDLVLEAPETQVTIDHCVPSRWFRFQVTDPGAYYVSLDQGTIPVALPVVRPTGDLLVQALPEWTFGNNHGTLLWQGEGLAPGDYAFDVTPRGLAAPTEIRVAVSRYYPGSIPIAADGQPFDVPFVQSISKIFRFEVAQSGHFQVVVHTDIGFPSAGLVGPVGGWTDLPDFGIFTLIYDGNLTPGTWYVFADAYELGAPTPGTLSVTVTPVP